MVERQWVRLNLTPEEVNLYEPPKGIDVSWVEWEKPNVVVAEFICSDLQPDPQFRKTEDDLRHEILTHFKGKLIDESLGGYHRYSQRGFKLDVVLNSPLVTGRTVPLEIKRAADAATEVHDVELTQKEVEQMKAVAVKAKALPNKHTQIEPKEKRLRKRKIVSRSPEGKEYVQEEPYEEVHVFEVGCIDSG